ncbi:hypothetical protein Tco_0518346 [Tanacetum coccineum]
METATLSHDGAAVGAPEAAAVSSVVQTIGSMANNADSDLSNLCEGEKRFPFSDLHQVASTDAECKDNGEPDHDSDDEDDDTGGGDDSDDDDDDEDLSDEDDEEDGTDSDSDANDDEDSDDDDEDSDDDDDEEDDDDDEDEDDNQPPCKKNK